jgi:Na+-transporting NADH:ubiquinone oxidoreductase subunit C
VHKNSYVLLFAAVVTITCSILLASAANLLKSRQQENIALDQRKNILECAGLLSAEDKEIAREEILNLYEKNIKSMVIDLTGNQIQDKQASDLDPKKDTEMLPIYYVEENETISSYIIPISGKGLWSTIFGYLALEPNASTVRGITFYQHGETPGLGGEIEKDWFKQNFIGKEIVSPNGELISITVLKGKVAEKIPERERYHYVDGISGSTLTCKGLTNFLRENLTIYNPYFKKLRTIIME